MAAAHPHAEHELLHVCLGRSGSPCVFSLTNARQPAAVPAAGQYCPWCAPDVDMSRFRNQEARKVVIADLKVFYNNNVLTHAAARLPEKHKHEERRAATFYCKFVFGRALQHAWEP